MPTDKRDPTADSKPGNPSAAKAKPKVKNRRNMKHKLYIWMRDHGLSDEKFGQLLISDDKPNGASKRTVFRWLTEGRVPELDVVQHIYDITDGYVGLMDWMTPYVAAKKAALKKAMAGRTRAKTAEKAKEPV